MKIGKPPVGSQWIHVFDRGGDNFEAMCRIKRIDCIIRAAQLQRKVLNQENQTVKLKSLLDQGEVLGTYELHLRLLQRELQRLKYQHFALPSRAKGRKPVAERLWNNVIVDERGRCERSRCPPRECKPVLWGLAYELTG